MQGVRAEDCENHLHQLHICLPSREGHTRLLYRMSMDFMGWTMHVPGIQQFWKYIAGQVREVRFSNLLTIFQICAGRGSRFITLAPFCNDERL